VTGTGEGPGPHERRLLLILLASTALVSVAAILYELTIASLSTYLVGNSVTQFSLTIGLYLSAMGLGSWLSQFVKTRLVERFILIELYVGVAGGASAWLLFLTFSSTSSTALYYAVMFGLTLLIGAGVGFEIPLLVRIVKRFASLPSSVANVLAADYLGSLVGSLAFPLVLLIYLGLLRTAFVVGAVNVVVAVVTAAVFRRHLRHPARLAGVGLLIAAGLGGAAMESDAILRGFERRLYRDPIEETIQSPYQRLVVTRGALARHRPRALPAPAERPERRGAFVSGDEDDLRLYLDGDLQLSSVDEYRYHEALVHPAMSALPPERQALDVLILGGGDGMAAREVLKHTRVGAVTLVDLDPAVVDLARRHPVLARLNRGALDDPRVTIRYEDAFTFMLRTPTRYHVIVVDLPDPDAAALSKLYSVTFYRAAAARLRPGGVIVTQASSPYFMPRAFWCVHRTLEAAGLTALPYAAYVPSFGLWGFQLAAPAPLSVADLRLPDLPLTYLSPALLPTLFTLPRDVRELPVAVNTLDRPVVVDYYLREE
jgi:spermidine synthase